MNANLASLLFFIFLLIFMGFVWSLARALIEPIVIQRKRESMCQHTFEKHTQDTGQGFVMETRFCPKCGAIRTLGYGVAVGVVKNPQKQRSKQWARR